MNETEQNKYREENRWRMITITISLIALVVSVPVSIKSCSNSTKALGLSENIFEETQKPELVLRPVNKDGQLPYVKYVDNDDSDDYFDIIIFTRILNIGHRPATNIVYPETNMSVNIKGQEIKSEDTDLESPISLSSQQHYFRKQKLTVNSRGFKSSQIIAELIEKNTPINIFLSVKYTDSITKKDYIVTAEYSVQRENFDILKYNHPQLVSD